MLLSIDPAAERDVVRLFLPEVRSDEQNETMARLAEEAEMAWRQVGHPGWYAAMEDGETLLDLFRRRVGFHCYACY